MTPEAQRIAIAEACGIVNEHHWGDPYYTPNAIGRDCPDYLNDLNAMHQAEESIQGANRARWMIHLCKITGDSFWVTNRATAAQRAEAFLRTLGKWEAAK
mgnify:CR=1 FL=1|tara:strand:- start:917 stop:1216 length:300 start_codon:yes stop_codon:yes gene_type:complete